MKLLYQHRWSEFRKLMDMHTNRFFQRTYSCKDPTRLTARRDENVNDPPWADQDY